MKMNPSQPCSSSARGGISHLAIRDRRSELFGKAPKVVSQSGGGLRLDPARRDKRRNHQCRTGNDLADEGLCRRDTYLRACVAAENRICPTGQCGVWIVREGQKRAAPAMASVSTACNTSAVSPDWLIARHS